MELDINLSVSGVCAFLFIQELQQKLLLEKQQTEYESVQNLLERYTCIFAKCT